MYWRTTRSLPTFIGKVEKILSRVLQPSMVLANSYAAKLDKQFPCPRLDVSLGFLAQSALQHPRRRCTHCLFRFGHPAFLQHICTSRHTAHECTLYIQRQVVVARPHDCISKTRISRLHSSFMRTSSQTSFNFEVIAKASSVELAGVCRLPVHS